MRRGEHVVGAIGLYDATDVGSAYHCLRILASIAALRTDFGVGDTNGRGGEAIPAIGEPDRVHSFTADLSLRGVDVEALGDALYPEVSVLVIRITNGMREPELLDAIIRAVQKCTA